MDLTSLDAARTIPFVIMVGWIAMIVLPYRAARSQSDACCPARALREAAEANAPQTPAVGGAGIGRQRAAKQSVKR